VSWSKGKKGLPQHVKGGALAVQEVSAGRAEQSAKKGFTDHRGYASAGLEGADVIKAKQRKRETKKSKVILRSRGPWQNRR